MISAGRPRHFTVILIAREPVTRQDGSRSSGSCWRLFVDGAAIAAPDGQHLSIVHVDRLLLWMLLLLLLLLLQVIATEHSGRWVSGRCAVMGRRVPLVVEPEITAQVVDVQIGSGRHAVDVCGWIVVVVVVGHVGNMASVGLSWLMETRKMFAVTIDRSRKEVVMLLLLLHLMVMIVWRTDVICRGNETSSAAVLERIRAERER